MNIAICDDDIMQRSTITQYINTFIADGHTIKTHEFASGEELIDSYKKSNTFDIIFLDIQMNGIDGIEVAKYIRERCIDAIIIFITSHTNYIMDTFRLNAFQFLTKPVTQNDFNIDFMRAVDKYKSDHFQYQITHKNKIIKIEIKDIQYLEVYDHQLDLHTIDEKYSFIGKLSNEEEKLKQYNFFRCHKSYLVNFNYIKKIDVNYLLLKNNIKIPVSKYKSTELKEKFCFFIVGQTI